ncbi:MULTISPECIES: ribbon-helix-helix domain-containing protein [unclassified Iodidimonas]|jgi:predicted DNA-binding ribbon-helix-helix protein|uniref:ribbon-helix-helix domain-containing protein n=1 Tax=unclassified Iodidimonas TaxID=2626145 RepID=UPI002482F8CE|nr:MULTISPECIES: ribbon-helix-helix domain-containing protein [unclassified Iodidimonas]
MNEGDDIGPIKRSVMISGHRTSISLEPAFWSELKNLAAIRHQSINALITDIDHERRGNLSSALRLFVLDQLKARARQSVPDGSGTEDADASGG